MQMYIFSYICGEFVVLITIFHVLQQWLPETSAKENERLRLEVFSWFLSLQRLSTAPKTVGSHENFVLPF